MNLRWEDRALQECNPSAQWPMDCRRHPSWLRLVLEPGVCLFGIPLCKPWPKAKNSSFLFDEVAIILTPLSIASPLAGPRQMDPALGIDLGAGSCFWR